MTAPGRSRAARLAARWAELGLARRISVAAVAMTLGFTFVAALLSFAVTWQVIRASLDARLSADAVLVAQRLSTGLDRITADLRALASNSLMSNALIDSQGREQYVTPFIRDFHAAGGGTGLRMTLCDFRGRGLVTDDGGARDFSRAAWLSGVMELARPHAELQASGDLLLAYPVVYPGTGAPEGLLVAEVSLEGSVRPRAGVAPDDLPWRVVAGDGRSVLASAPDLSWPEMVTRRRAVRASPPLDALGLQVEVGVPRSAEARPLAILVAGYLAATVLLVGAALGLARRLANRVTEPLRALGHAAQEIAAAGTFGLDVPVQGGEETARLATAFNDMLRRLRDATEARYALQVAHRREAESALRSAHLAMEQASEAIAILDRRGRFTYANRAAVRLVSRGDGTLVGARYWELDPSRSPEWWEELWGELHRRGTVLVQGTLRRDGRPVHVETSFSAFQLEGSEHCVATARDVTDRAQAELVSRLASLGTLAAGVAHEVNNPLAYITSNLEFVRGTLDPASGPVDPEALAELRQAVEDSSDGVRRVREIVRSLKRFSGPERADRVALDVCAELDASLALASTEIRHRARLEKRLAPVAPVLAAEHELAQVFVNLLVNAAQAIPEGRSDDNVVRLSCAMDCGEVVVEVGDTGAGIPPDVRSRMFEPFFTTKPVGIGTGLGLSICHGIVGRLGGRIEVESEVGRGSTFRVYLPAADPAGPPPP